MARRETKTHQKNTRAGLHTLQSVSPALIVVLALASGLVAGCKATSLLADLKARVAETIASGAAAIAAPVFSPSAGTYASDQSVTITSATEGASIRYTITDGATGTAPTESSTEYTAAVPISGNGTTKTIEAIAVKEGMSSSQVAVATYVIRYDRIAKPTISPTTGSYSSDQNVTIECSTQGATIHYTVADGATGSTPTAASPAYTSPIPVAGDGTVKTIRAIAVKPGLADSEIASSTITINYGQVSTPQLSPTAGTYAGDQLVSITDSTPGATIHYTTNGSPPTSSSPAYSNPISVSGDGVTMTIRAIATLAGMFDSTEASATYTIQYPHIVYFYAQGGLPASPASKSVVYNEQYGTLATTSRTGYTFNGWWTGDKGTGTQITATSMVNFAGNQNLYASWIPKDYTVLFNSQGGSTPNPTSKTVTYDLTYGALPTTSRDGCTFAGWYTSTSGGSHVISTTSVKITSTQTLYAQWSISDLATATIGTLKGVAGGTFNNGTSDVTVSSFWMGDYEINQAQYGMLSGDYPSHVTGPGLPVEQVTWYDAVEFCNTLSQSEGFEEIYTITGRTPASGHPITSATVTMDRSKNGYRLPTEAEWEFAARGGNSTHGYTYSGSNTVGDVAWYQTNSGSTTHQVGTKTENELGINDLSGNVVEWCWDWYGSYPSGAQTDPTGSASGTYRIARGGSWSSYDALCSVSSRDMCTLPSSRNSGLGFRVVRSLQ